MEEADIRLVEQYLQGRLDEPAAEAFRQRLAAEPDLLAEVSTQLAVRQGREQALEQEIASLFQEEGTTASTTLPNPTRIIGLSVMGTIAAAILVWFLIRGLSPPSLQQLFARHFDPAENTVSVLSADPQSFEQAFERYDAGDYAAAIRLFEQLENLSAVQQAEIDFYRANAFLAIDQPRDAIPILQVLAQQSGSALAPEAAYYLGLAYLATDQPAEALAQFQAVSSQGLLGVEEQQHAQALVEVLEGRQH